MTDLELERLRDRLLARDAAIIDAHLKADAKRDRRLNAYRAEDYPGQVNDLLTELARRRGENAALRDNVDRQHRERTHAEREVARLREERDKLHALYNRAQDDASREAGIRVEQGFELARLREENAALHLMAQRPDMDLFRENARLRENYDTAFKDWKDAEVHAARLREELDLKDGLLNQAKGELARLRANQETDMSAVSECIEENIRLLAALREIADGTYEGYDMTPGGAPTGMTLRKRMSRKMMRNKARAAIAEVES